MTDVLTFKEAAIEAYVSFDTINYWVKTGRLPTIPGPLSVRTGKPYGRRILRDQLVAATPESRIAELKKTHHGDLMTVGELCTALRLNAPVIYHLINKRYLVNKFYVDKWTYLIDLNELVGFMSYDLPYCYYLSD